MARNPDYYKALGVDRKATPDEIKKAYRKLARQYHPDTNKEPGAEARFKEISEAHDVLVRSREAQALRPRRDVHGHAVRRRDRRGRRRGRQCRGLRLLLGHPLGHLQLRRAGRGRRTRPAGRARPRPRDRRSRCPSSRPSRARRSRSRSRRTSAVHRRAAAPAREPGTVADRLPGVPGSRRRVPGPGAVLDHPPVLALRRLGHRDRGSVPDLRRRGAPARAQEVPREHPAPGSRRARRIRLAGKGEAGLRGGPAGDLYVVTHVGESSVFRRKGDHFEVDVPITIAEALRGADVEVPTLNGTKTLRVRAGHASTGRCSGCAARARRCSARAAPSAATSATAS